MLHPFTKDHPRAEEQPRARLLALFLVLQVVVSIAFLPLWTWRIGVPPMALISVASLVVALVCGWLLRYRGHLQLSAGITLTFAALSTFVVGLLEGAPEVVMSPWWAVLPLLGGYLAGRRVAFLLGALAASCMVALLVLHRLGLVIPLEPFPADVTMMFFGHGLATAFVWGFALLADRQRRTAVAAVEEANARLRDREARLHALFDHTINLVCSVDRDLRLTAVNRPMREQWRELFDAGIEPGTPLLDNLPPASTDVPAWEQELRRAMDGQPVRTTHVLDTLRGRRHLSVSVNPIAVGGDVVGASLYAQDITDRVEADERLDRARRQLIDLSRQAGMTEMATGLLHDVGNVLNSITVATSTVHDRLHGLRLDGLRRLAGRVGDGDSPDQAEIARYLAALNEHLASERARLLEQVQHLERDVTRVRTIVATQERYTHRAGVVERIALDDLLEAAVEPCRLVLARSELHLRVEAEAMDYLEVDRGRILQILSNLLDNAQHSVLTAGRDEGRVVVRGRAAGPDRFAIDVIDNGVGIATEDQTHLFEHGWSTKEEAHGFGLHTSANAASEMDGSLTVHSEGADKGARFTLELPRSAARTATPRRRHRRGAGRTG